MITESQEAAVADARTRAAQDKKIPFLINTKDGRLIPHTPGNAKLRDYMPFHGAVKATREERLAYVRSGPGHKRAVVMPAAEPEAPFDISKATKDELVAFAFEQYQAALNPADTLPSLRKQVVDLARAHENLA